MGFGGQSIRGSKELKAGKQSRRRFFPPAEKLPRSSENQWIRGPASTRIKVFCPGIWLSAHRSDDDESFARPEKKVRAATENRIFFKMDLLSQIYPLQTVFTKLINISGPDLFDFHNTLTRLHICSSVLADLLN